jgi:hypothetical protein
MQATKCNPVPGLNESPWRRLGPIIAPWTMLQKRSSTQPARLPCHRIVETVEIAGIAGGKREAPLGTWLWEWRGILRSLALWRQ